MEQIGNYLREADPSLEEDIAAEVGNYPFKCWRARNAYTEQRYINDLMKNNYGPHGEEKFLWHGSADVNWPGILHEGLKIRPLEAEAKDEGWFGKGIYFSRDFNIARWYSERKSKNKMCYVALFRVRIGKCCDIELPAGKREKHYEIGKNFLESRGFDSVHVMLKVGKSLREREIAIFNPAQATIYALVKLLK